MNGCGRIRGSHSKLRVTGLAIAMTVSILLLLSCTPMWTIEFQLREKFDNEKLKGWIIEPDIFSAKNVIADKELLTFKDDYFIQLEFRLPNKRKRIAFYDPDIDSIKIIMQDNQDTVFIKNNSFFYSYKSHKEIFKFIAFAPKNVQHPDKDIAYGLRVPQDVDTLIIKFDVILNKAEYFSYVNKTLANIVMDSLRIIENREPIIVPVELKLHKYVSKM
jgi:hypothetical protein